MGSDLYRIDRVDLIKGAITAVLAAVLTTLYGVVTQAGFDVFAANWGVIFGQVLNVSLTAFIAYIMKNFFSDEDGNPMGVMLD